MNYRRLGRTDLQVSSVGFGTNQLRLLPEETAINVLLQGFRKGVNLVHVSTDYEGAERIVAKAMRRHQGTVIPAINSYDVHGSEGDAATGFRNNFEKSCEIFGTEQLPLYGIAAMEDREALRENVWGKDGIVEFLQKMKRQGRIGHLFCTSHGKPEYVKKLIESDVFDAIMLSYNPLGFHLLSLNPPGNRGFENLARTKLDLFPLCREKDIGVMVMMPLAGGLLVEEKGFPSTGNRPTGPVVEASTVLRSILEDKDVSSVMPGVTSVEEALENAEAGCAPAELQPTEASMLDVLVSGLLSSVCCRCGACEPLCSQSLPVSWMFRAAEMAEHPSEFFETWKEVDYFTLHPSRTAACDECRNVTCACPYGIEIPKQLSQTHSRMVQLMESAKVPPPLGDLRAHRGTKELGAQIIRIDVSENPEQATSFLWRIQLENAGTAPWGPGFPIVLSVSRNDEQLVELKPRQPTYQGGRAVFSFEVPQSGKNEVATLQVSLANEESASQTVEIFRGTSDDLEMLHTEPGREQMNTSEKKDQPYAVEWIEHNVPESWPEGSRMQLYVRIHNSGTRSWSRDGKKDVCGPVQLTVSLDDRRVSMVPIPHDISPGETGIVGALIDMPDGMGDWRIEVSLVEQGVAWFHERGASPLTAQIARKRRDGIVDQETIVSMLELNPAFYVPAEGIAVSRDGRPFPNVMAEAKGATIKDNAGNEWIDYAMGWGSALLGHAHPEVTSAVSDALSSGAITSLPHRLEAEVSEALNRFIPSCEMVLFGKNGSDACSAAVRVARVFTGKKKILFSGFHGWKDPFAQAFETALADGETGNLIRFRLNDLNGLAGLIKTHGQELAALIIEPAAQVEGIDGPVRDVDPKFLAEAAAMTREAGALVIFDEILTGFRYLKGSVQAATNVIPDLTCLGKGMASGMPLSALVGKRRIMGPTLSRIFYHPTFKSEVYSFAAAKAALQVHWNTDVPGAINRFGTKLKQEVGRLAKEANIDGELIGLPFRLVFRFNGNNAHQNALYRTLLQQELLLRGIMTFRGFMLPSLAHGESELEKTLDAFKGSFARVNEVAKSKQFAKFLEIPLLV